MCFADERNLFLINCHISLISGSEKKTSGHIECVLKYVVMKAEKFRGLLSDASGRKPCNQRSSRYYANIYEAIVR